MAGATAIITAHHEAQKLATKDPNQGIEAYNKIGKKPARPEPGKNVLSH